MGRRALVISLLALGVLPILVAGCGGGASPKAPLSHVEQPRLINIGGFALMKDVPTHVALHATKTHPLRIYILADRTLDSITLRRIADADGNLVTPKSVAIQGSPHALGEQTVYGLTAKPIEPGFYRLDLLGRGQVQSFVVQDW